MGFLRNLTFLGLLVGVMAAAPSSGQTVTCKGMSYGNDVTVGYDNGNPVVIKILNNRIYMQKEGRLWDNLGVIYAINSNAGGNNPPASSYFDSWYLCVNVPDPSTSIYNQPPYNYLDASKNTSTSIWCNGKTINQNVWLAGWKDGSGQGQETPNGGVTYMLPKVVDGMLRINGVRKNYPNNGPDGLINNTDAPNDANALLWPSFANGYGNPNLGFTLTENEVNACVWKAAPKYPDVSNGCSSNPVIGTISSPSKTGLTFNFSGSGLPGLKWRIYNGLTERSGTTGANTGGETISFSSVPAGDYTLEIEGNTCSSSKSSKGFSIPKDNCSPAPTISNTTNVGATGLTVNFSGSTNAQNIAWVIKNSSSQQVASGTSSVSNSTSAALTFSTLGSGTYTLEVQGGDCNSSVSQQQFSISCGGYGPNPNLIDNISTTGLRFRFDGGNVGSIDWRILDGSSNAVRTGNVVPQGNQPSISFNALSGGGYTLELKGNYICSPVTQGSAATMAFTISGSVSCSTAPVISTITSISQTGLTVNFTASNSAQNVNWVIKDGIGTTVRSGNKVTSGANSTSISYSELPIGTYSLEIQGGDCTSSVSSQGFTIPKPVCTAGPNVTSITGVSATGLTFYFYGQNVGSVDWRILNSSSTQVAASSSSIYPSNDHPAITFSSLSNGTYTLEIQGGATCSSTPSTMTFTIGAAPCSSNPVIGTISAVSQTGLTFSFSGSGLPNLKWRVKPVVSNVNNERSGQTSSANTSGETISFNSLPAGSYTLEIEGGTCASTVNSQGFTIPKPNCTTAPVISTISSVTDQLTVNFTGTNSAQNVDWIIKNGSGNTVASGNKTTNGAASAVFTFNALASKTNTLEVTGGDCVSSTSSKQFTAACNYGPSISSILNVSSAGLKFYFGGGGIYSIDWRILNSSNVPIRSSSSTIVPQNNNPDIVFSPGLANGTYTLEIQGGPSCQSTPETRQFTVTNSSLPINVADFKASVVKQGVELTWSVVSELNGKGFEVLRYDDTVKSPTVIADIPLTDARIGNYKFVDQAPENGVNYYQLKQVDMDGSFILSRIISAKFEQLYEMFVSPNPAKEYAEVVFESRVSGTALFDTYTIGGIRIKSSEHKVKMGRNVIRVNLGGLSEGSYVLKVREQNESHSLRFLKIN